MQDFDKAFDEFLSEQECEKSWEQIQSIIRRAYLAGWLAAGGKLPGLKNRARVYIIEHED